MTPHELLGLPRDANREQIKARYRRLAQVAHPDKGGDTATFATLQAVYEEALELADKPYCEECEGTGYARKISIGSIKGLSFSFAVARPCSRGCTPESSVVGRIVK